ncbi:serine/threonine-protein kinase 11-interacting protein isoform X2 [Brachyhypopomus gauderio]|uniref:serine/threonine-protein kinase 11-interacting protein isoform X2 n=1 Tax=Brachyhypopomus gauderio TaxID=698409 RepID=UPI004042DA64
MMSGTRGGRSTLVHSLATLLRSNGDSVLDGSSVLTLQADCVQHLTHLFEQYLLSRTQQHGFLALPSHPADTVSLLQLQFIFDVLQKTLALKLINPPGSSLQSVVKIFPFKSLKHLELKRIPPGCLQGLRGVYSQLEVFTCSRALTTLKELLLHCGGDLSSALPWLELHTLNFSYNSISSLDDSLSLLNVLKSLDLSHNRIQDCAEFLMPLGELQRLNLAYNNLQGAPQLAHNCRAKLITLVLRNNELETINGVELLSSLQHLDLAYNLLLEHSKLTPLSGLHNLQTLMLEGNPLYFQKTHRLSTVSHLSPRAASQGLLLDGSSLSSAELAAVPKQKMGQTCQAHQVAVAPEQVVQDVSSGGGDMSDGLSVSESGAGRIRRRRSRVKVRAASISEPSDTDHEPRQTALQDVVLPHQKDIERMDSFRQQMGEDWLRFQHHLDGSLDPALLPAPGAESGVAQVTADSGDAPRPPRPEMLPAPLLSSEPKGEEELDTESTLQWSGHSPLSTESTLETSAGEPQASVTACTLPAPEDEQEEEEEEEEDLGVDLCRPTLVQVLSEGQEVEGSTPHFLRVRQGHVQEVEVHKGRVRTQLELSCLTRISVSQATWVEKEEERSQPALELHFNYINRSKRKRRYAMLDEDPQQAVQALVEVLSRVVEENEQQVVQERERVRLQCLKCHSDFPRPGDETPSGGPDRPPACRTQQGGTGRPDAGHGPDDIIYCPECSSDHVVHLTGHAALSTSTPVNLDAGQNANSCFHFDDIDTPVRPQMSLKTQSPDVSLSGSPLCVSNDSEFSTVQEGATDTYLTAHSSLSNLTTNQSEAWSDQPIGSRSVDMQAQGDPEAMVDGLKGSGVGPQEHPEHPQSAPHVQGPGCVPFDLTSEDFEAVDHRLKLFLDVEVFEGEEEIHCFLKMSVVKFGDPVEFPSLMVVSDQHIYILEITSQSKGQPSDWLRKRASHRLCELSYLEVGLGSQTIHMEFEETGAAYTLLVRDAARCRRFYSHLTGLTRELAPKSDSKLRGISTTRLNPKHHLWPLVCEASEMAMEGDSHPPFLYLLAFLQRGDGLTSVTVLATRDTLCLLDEDHQWSKRQSELQADEAGQTSSARVTVREIQPISCVSSILLSSSDPCQVDIKLYDEMSKEERTWSLRTEAGQEIEDLVSWVRSQWEDMFGVRLLTAVQ